MTGELPRIAREDRNREYDQRHDSQCNRWGETMERKEKAGHACRDRRDQKPLGPAIEALAGEHSKQNDQAGKNSEQADQYVNYCVNVQYHGLRLITFI